MAFRRLPNLTNALVMGGVVALGFTVFVPPITAERAARVETRAEQACRGLLETASALAPSNLDDPGQLAALTEAFVAACRDADHPESYLPRPVEKPRSLTDVECALFESKHYCFMLTRESSEPGAEASGRLEVYAWPQTLQPPGHTAFYFPTAGQPAFSRNLMHQYVGWDEDPRSGRAIPRPGAGSPRRAIGDRRDYRGKDDERWLLLR